MTGNCPSFVRHQSLEATQVIPLFDSTTTTFTSTPPFKPKAGEVYVMKLDIGHENDWRSDGYRWVQIAARRLPTHNPVIKKCYFHAGQKNKKKSKDFEKQAFVSLVDPSKVVVQYLGDENVAEEFPHGNSKKNTKPFFRTRPSLLNKLISEAASNAETAQIFKQYTTNNSHDDDDHDDDDDGEESTVNNSMEAEETVDDNDDKKPSIIKTEPKKPKIGPEILSQPRNIEQIRNVKRRLARRLVASADEISELYRFARETPNYIVRFTLIPNIVAIAFSNESMHEFNLLLDHPDLLSQQRVLITFDSAYTINAFHVTCVFYRHIGMKEEPCILLGCALHNRRSDDVYEYILTHLKQQCPNIESRCLFIIDSEGNTLKNNYLSIFLPHLRVIHTWNYVFSQLRAWLLQNGRTQADYQFYNAELKSLLLCADMLTFTRLYDRCKSNWTQEFRTYFEQIILPLVDTDLGSWILKKYDLFDAYSGIKGLVCEPMQAVAAQLRDWRESRFDSGAMAFYWLQMYFVQQIRKSYSRLGGIYTLKQGIYEKWAIAAVTSITAHEPIKALVPEKIVEHVRAKVIISSVHHPHLQAKRNNEQQILTLSPIKRLKTTTYDGPQHHHHHHQPCIIATTTTTPHHVTTADIKATLLAAAAAQQPRTMTIRRIATTTSPQHQQQQQQTTFRLTTTPSTSSSQQPQQFIITTAGTALPLSQTTTTTTGLVDDSSMYDDGTSDLSGCLVTTSSQTSSTPTSQTRSSFVRPALPTNVLRLTVVRK
ncbi:unnamed protein product [Rotaria sordida]|uniref:MULE transposase domain-containing protein n=1 Tax=Rotaria sordida TaxID=392033 RepID=A0A818ZKJ2_9BILA|nr:unnamed protein product [Rotaria sordida]CAF3771408.1 unnamed protein product [Rotaria sordida]